MTTTATDTSRHAYGKAVLDELSPWHRALRRASYYCAHPAGQQQVAPPSQPSQPQDQQRRPQRQPRALTEQERAAVLAVLHSERFADAARATVTPLCSTRAHLPGQRVDDAPAVTSPG